VKRTKQRQTKLSEKETEREKDKTNTNKTQQERDGKYNGQSKDKHNSARRRWKVKRTKQIQTQLSKEEMESGTDN